MRLGATAATAALLMAAACGAPRRNGRPDRVVAGESGTIILNTIRPARLPVRVLDAAGRTLSDSGVRYTWVSGDALPVADTGTVTCDRAGDAIVRVSVRGAATNALVRCRPVHHLDLMRLVQARVGDSAQRLPLRALDADYRPVTLLNGKAWIADSRVALLEGLMIRPLASGAAVVSVAVGDRMASGGVHIYAPTETLDGLQRNKTLLAVPLHLANGEMRRWRLPYGGWMITMLPENDSTGIRLRIEGATCSDNTVFSKRRFLCSVRDSGTVTVYYQSPGGAPERSGEILVRPLYGNP